MGANGGILFTPRLIPARRPIRRTIHCFHIRFTFTKYFNLVYLPLVKVEKIFKKLAVDDPAVFVLVRDYDSTGNRQIPVGNALASLLTYCQDLVW